MTIPADNKTTVVADPGEGTLHRGDDTADLANAGASTVSVLVGNSDETFQMQAEMQYGGNAASIAMGDVNGDGKHDLVAADIVFANVAVLLGHGDGTFATPVDITVGRQPASGAILDLNVDNKADVVMANYRSYSVYLLLGKGDGTFQPHANYTSGSVPGWTAAGDMNGDGRPDLVCCNRASNNVSVLLNTGDGTSPRRGTTRLDSEAWASRWVHKEPPAPTASTTAGAAAAPVPRRGGWG